MSAELHLCVDDRLVYLPALDPLAVDIPGGARVFETIAIELIPNFDFDARQDGDCWICAYAEALCRGRADPPRQPEIDEHQYVLVRARARLRASHVLAAARRVLAEVEPERRAAADAMAPHYREATPEEVHAEKEKEALATRFAGTIARALENLSLGATSTEAVAMAAKNAPIKDDVLEVPPEAIDAVSHTRGRGKKKSKKFSGGGGQQSMF